MSQDAASHLDGDDRTSEFLRLLNQHERALNAYILTLCPHWTDSEDIAQETRIRLWKQFDKYQPGTDFGAWARSVAYYLVLTYREKSNRDRLRFGPAFYESVAAVAASRPRLVAARQDALGRCMEKLDAPKRRLIEGYYSDDQSLKELARRLGRSYDSVRKAVYRTQLMLADCIESEIRRKEAGE